MSRLHQVLLRLYPKPAQYDRLVIATGAVPVRPHIPGIDLPGVYLLRSMQDSFAVHEYLDTHAPRSAVIVGGGYIGMERADALTHPGLAVTVVEHGAWVLKTVDKSLGRLVSAELPVDARAAGVEWHPKTVQGGPPPTLS